MAQNPLVTRNPFLARIFGNNAQWADGVQNAERRSSADGIQGQSPEILWIGCSDSRVSETVITGCKPGDIFVHRNIGNQFKLTDDSAAAVLAYAVETLGVSHIVVVGHTDCGAAASCHAAAAAPPSAPQTPLARWLQPLSTLARELVGDERARDLRALEEANVRAQVANISANPVMRAAWAQGKAIAVHGWIYELESGRLVDLNVSVDDK